MRPVYLAIFAMTFAVGVSVGALFGYAMWVVLA